MLSRYDGRFAAAIPISGGIAASDFVPSRLIDTPIITLHARDDDTAPVTATRNLINSILAAAGDPLPTYLSTSNPATFALSNANLPFHTEFRTLIHQQENSVDFLVTDPRLDLLYYEPQLGGHTGMLGALEAPELYDWLFSHTTAVSEPTTGAILFVCVCMAGWLRRRRMSPQEIKHERQQRDYL
jgi:hypothetical protein